MPLDVLLDRVVRICRGVCTTLCIAIVAVVAILVFPAQELTIGWGRTAESLPGSEECGFVWIVADAVGVPRGAIFEPVEEVENAL